MTAAREILQRLIDAGGTVPRGDFKQGSGHSHVTIWLLRERGLITIDVHITDSGRREMSNPELPRKIGKRRKFCPAQDLLDGFMRFPVASTDEQIDKLKEQAEADRSFASISRRRG